MHVGVLGTTEVIDRQGTAVDLGSRKQRALLAALALHRGRPVPVDTIVDLLWSDRPPDGVHGTLQGYVAGLRRALEPDRVARAPAHVLVTQSPGYALAVPPARLDLAVFEDAVSRAQATHPVGALLDLDPVPRDADLLAGTLAQVDDALALWRGTPFADLGDAPAAAAERGRLDELHLAALELRAAVALWSGQHTTVAAELETLTTKHPYRERLWALRALALARSGRQVEALEVLAAVRTLLVEELGLEPGADIRAMQAAILRQDPALSPHAPRAAAAPAVALPSRPTTAAWPMVGRDRELETLVSLLERAAAGEPVFGSLVGEPGIGKSRLAGELAAVARQRGHRVLVGRCSQDDGAPPLWPWRAILGGLGASLPTEDHDDEGGRFRSWYALVDTVAGAAAEGPVLVVLDDLHWADVSSLRVLSLLLETVHEGHLMVLATWRDRPEPTGALATVTEGLARRHAERHALAGLADDDVATVVEAVATTRPSAADVAALQHRTDGNPFFLVEYARLVDEQGPLGSLLAETHPPGAVHDVLTRRVSRLPDLTVRTLRVAAVVGRHFDLATLARVLGSDPDDLLDALDAAAESGLVREDGVDAFRFSHALVRDSVLAGLSPSRRARLHARVAAALERVPDRETEVARHWLEAGPDHVGPAWRTAIPAADAAHRVYAYDEAADVLRGALAAVTADPAATLTDRFAVLEAYAAALQRAGDWLTLRPVVHQALQLAEHLGDPDRMLRIAVMPSTGALWQSAQHGRVDPVVAGALRFVLDHLPEGDGASRCRATLSLAGELYYRATPAEREALADEALAMARRLDDPALLVHACFGAAVATWRAGNAERRFELTAEAAALGAELGDDTAVSLGLTMQAVVAAELGQIEEMERLAARAREHAERLHHLYALLVLHSTEVTWMAMRGEFDATLERLEVIRSLTERLGLEQAQDALNGAVLMLLLWQDQYATMLPILREMEAEESLPLAAVVAAFLVRAGRVEEARAYHARHPVDLEEDTWFSPVVWALSAEVALELGDRALAEAAYARLSGLAGRPCSAGSGSALGPADAFLAMAAAATGERELAARHADAAVARCRAWRAPLAERWVLRQRERHGY